MEPDFKVNSLVIIKRGDFSDVQEGDIIAFKAAALGGKSALHRVVRVTSDGVYTMGDNGKHADNQLITRSEYIGKAVFHTNIFADYFTKLKKTDGVLVYFIFPLIALSAFVCAIKVLTDKKKPCKRQAVVFLIFKGPPRY
jgi:signal peptidase I